jgi:hypothetical protein
MPSSLGTAVTVLPEESTSAIASRLNSSVYRFVYLLPTWCYSLWNLRSQSPGVQDQGEASPESCPFALASRYVPAVAVVQRVPRRSRSRGSALGVTEADLRWRISGRSAWLKWLFLLCRAEASAT